MQRVIEVTAGEEMERAIVFSLLMSLLKRTGRGEGPGKTGTKGLDLGDWQEQRKKA